MQGCVNPASCLLLAARGGQVHATKPLCFLACLLQFDSRHVDGALCGGQIGKNALLFFSSSAAIVKLENDRTYELHKASTAAQIGARLINLRIFGPHVHGPLHHCFTLAIDFCGTKLSICNSTWIPRTIKSSRPSFTRTRPTT